MAKAEFNSYGGKEEFLEHKDGKIDAFVEKSGGPVDPFGDEEKKEKDTIDMNAGEAFNKKDYTKVEAMGTDYAKKKYNQVEEHEDGEHFNTEEVDAFGNDAGKKKSFQSDKRK